MMNLKTLTRTFAGYLLLASIVNLTGCSGEAAPAPAEHSYKVRGEIIALPREAQSPRQLRIRHQAIPNYVGPDGKAETMPAMTMDFPLADSIDVTHLSVGDEIEAIYELRWKSKPREVVSSVTKLAAGSLQLAPKS